MAIIGGAGNPVGGSFTGPAEALEFTGNFCYAYSGVLATGASGSADVTALKFTTGSHVINCTVTQCDDGGGSADKLMTIKLNGATIWQARYTDNATNISEQPLPLVISPYTEVEVLIGSAGTENMSVMLVGEVQRD